MRAFLMGEGNRTATVSDTNFIEWYFVNRMVLDLFEAIDLVPPSAAVATSQRMNGGNPVALSENRRVNVPALAVRATEGIIQGTGGLSGNLAFVFYRNSTSIPGNSFLIREMTNYAHSDILTSLEKRSREGKNVPEFVVDFVQTYRMQ
jgi:hypothetical protein